LAIGFWLLAIGFFGFWLLAIGYLLLMGGGYGRCLLLLHCALSGLLKLAQGVGLRLRVVF
jgi:hypothetical protein